MVCLQAGRLLLREYLESDIGTVHAYGSSAEVTKYEVWGPNTEDDSAEFLRRCIDEALDPARWVFNLAVCLADTGIHIGGSSIRRESEMSLVGSLGWVIDPRYQGLGYATEAGGAMIQFGLRDLGLAVVYATCDTRNVASFRVMEKLGMRRVGLQRGVREVKGHRRDTYRYEIGR